jgi:hypothetical protein
MVKRSTIFVAALVLFAGAVPAGANAVHTEKGASGQGLAADAFFDPSTPVNGITVTPFDDQGTIYDVFQIPSSFESGTPFTLTFANINDGYGIFDCDNGTNGFALSADTPPINIGSTCTAGPAGSNDGFVNFSGRASYILFLDN